MYADQDSGRKTISVSPSYIPCKWIIEDEEGFQRRYFWDLVSTYLLQYRQKHRAPPIYIHSQLYNIGAMVKRTIATVRALTHLNDRDSLCRTSFSSLVAILLPSLLLSCLHQHSRSSRSLLHLSPKPKHLPKQPARLRHWTFMRILLWFCLLAQQGRWISLTVFVGLVRERRLLWAPPPPPPFPVIFGDLAVGKGDSRGGTGEYVRHADDEEGDEKSGAEKGGGETGAGVEMGGHGC